MEGELSAHQCPLCANLELSRVSDRDRWKCGLCYSEFGGQILRERENDGRALRDRERWALLVPLRRRPVVVEMRNVRVTIEEAS